MENEKEALERWFHRVFKDAYTEYPIGETTKEDPPFTDYLIKTEKELIGLEITEIYQDSTEHGSLLKQRSEAKAKINEGVLEKLEPLVGFKFIVDIELDDSKPYSHSNLKKIINRVVDCCVELFSEMPPNESWEFFNIETDLKNHEARNIIMAHGYRNLPEPIRSIQLTREDSLTSSLHIYPETGVVPNLTENVLLKTIRDKDAKIEKYKPCDKFWLLIVEGRYLAQNFDEIQVATPVPSKYDKVFLLRIMKDEVVILK